MIIFSRIIAQASCQFTIECTLEKKEVIISKHLHESFEEICKIDDMYIKNNSGPRDLLN